MKSIKISSDEELIELYLKYKSSLSAFTQKNYHYVLKRVSRYFNLQKISLLDTTEEDITRFIAQYDFRSTKETYRVSLNVFYKWCVKRGYRSENPIDEITISSGKKKIVEPMKSGDYSRVQKRCQGIRELTIVNCLWYTGMRGKELRFLQIEDIDLTRGTIQISNSKTTSGYRIIPIHPSFKSLLDKYLRKRLTLRTEENWLFLTKRGTQFQERTLVHYIQRLQSDLEIRFGCHDFRRAFITRLYRKTKDLVLCQRLAGHASIKTTQRYIIDDIEEHMQKFNSLNF